MTFVVGGSKGSQTHNAATRATTSAIGPNGRTIWFDDLVRDGETVEVAGCGRMVVRYDPAAPDWFAERDREGVLDVDALSRRVAHALHGVFMASHELRMPPTSAEVCIYDEEAVSVKATAAALREAQKLGLVVNAGGCWFPIGLALDAGSIPFDDRYSRDVGGEDADE